MGSYAHNVVVWEAGRRAHGMPGVRVADIGDCGDFVHMRPFTVDGVV